jgi:hypothetical protein
MPALNVTFTDQEMTEVRDVATREDISLKSFAHDAVLAEARRREITALAVRTARISAGLNRRLATQ